MAAGDGQREAALLVQAALGSRCGRRLDRRGATGAGCAVICGQPEGIIAVLSGAAPRDGFGEVVEEPANSTARSICRAPHRWLRAAWFRAGDRTHSALRSNAEARSGGCRYAMSRTFSMNRTRDSLKVSQRCGFRPNARQMRLTVAALSPHALAIERVLQCVAPAGIVSKVCTTTRSTSSSPIVRGAPRSRLVHQTIAAGAQKPPPPLADGTTGGAQFAGYLQVALAGGRLQHDARPARPALEQAWTVSPSAAVVAAEPPTDLES